MLLEKLVTTIAEMAQMKRLAPTCTAFNSPSACRTRQPFLKGGKKRCTSLLNQKGFEP